MTLWECERWLSVLLCAYALGLAQGKFLGLREGTRDCTIFRTSLQGTCQSIYECPFVLKTYQQLTPTFCYLQGRIPYVCCPTRKPSTTTDVSAPSVRFTCGTSSSKPLSQQFKETLITRFLASPAVSASLPSNAGFAPGSHSKPAGAPPFFDVSHVVAGIDSKKNSWPWMALLGYGSKSSPRWACDGVLINELWVLTAAHCVIKEFASVVRLGEHNLRTTTESSHDDFGISKTEFHPDYFFPRGYHDLALIKLDRPVNIRNAMRPVCLPWGRKPIPTVGSELTLTGWGRTTFGGNHSDILQEASVHMVDPQECINGYSTLSDYKDIYPRGITSDLLCIGDKDGQGQDACQGDSGGPVVYLDGGRYTLTGIVSKGYGCGNHEYPGLYASAHHAPDLAWIKRIAF